MNKKYLIFGATGSIGSSLADKLYEEKKDCHLIARNEDELKKLANKLSYSFSVCDVLTLDHNFWYYPKDFIIGFLIVS